MISGSLCRHLKIAERFVIDVFSPYQPEDSTWQHIPTKNKPAPKPVPLQVRWPREDVKAIKVAAAQVEQTISEFMLACFHAYMKSRKHA
jgi:hypothetical protein